LYASRHVDSLGSHVGQGFSPANPYAQAGLKACPT
jgi:hypothetical protein